MAVNAFLQSYLPEVVDVCDLFLATNPWLHEVFRGHEWSEEVVGCMTGGKLCYFQCHGLMRSRAWPVSVTHLLEHFEHCSLSLRYKPYDIVIIACR